jgi:hypothetical protein
MYKENVAVFSDMHMKHTARGEHHVECLNVKPGGK